MRVKSILKDTFILFAVTFVLALMLSGVKVITQKAIDEAANKEKIEAFNSVMNGLSSFEDITYYLDPITLGSGARLTEEEESILRCKDSSDKLIGYILRVSARGYASDLNLIVGFDTNAQILGVAYANKPSETPGLGMKTTESTFLDSFIGHNFENLDSVDTISGATVSSSAFKNAVSLATQYAKAALKLN